MIKTVKVTKHVVQHDISSVICNLCGKEMKTPCSPMGNGINVRYEGGYDSMDFGDGTVVEFDLCEKCLFEWIKSFELPAKIEHRYFVEEEGQ